MSRLAALIYGPLLLLTALVASVIGWMVQAAIVMAGLLLAWLYLRLIF